MIGGRRTSMRLEPQMWDALADIARWEGATAAELIEAAVASAAPGQSNTSAVRSYVLSYFRDLVTEETRVVARQPGPTR